MCIEHNSRGKTRPGNTSLSVTINQRGRNVDWKKVSKVELSLFELIREAKRLKIFLLNAYISIMDNSHLSHMKKEENINNLHIICN